MLRTFNFFFFSLFISLLVSEAIDAICLVIYFDFWIQFLLRLDVPQIESAVGGFWAERITIPYAVYWAERKSNIKAGRILRLPIWSGVEKME